MPTTVLRADPRFALASRTRNGRFPSRSADVAGRVAYCYDAEDVVRTLQQVLDAGLRPTVRSSGHCYEDFVVNNPNGAILDVSNLRQVSTGAGGAGRYSLGPGTMLGDAYQQLYTRAGKCIPGGTCYTVTAGGHISGGGYGTLVRLYGLTVDWVTAIDVVTVDAAGKAVARHVDKAHDPDLFRALRGGQGSSFGIITAFYFDELPRMPDQVVSSGMSWDWNDVTEDKYVRILRTWGDWHAKNCDKKETWGMFGGLHMTSKSSGRMGLSVAFTQPEGEVTDLSVLKDLLDAFQQCKPLTDDPNHGLPPQAAQERRGGYGPAPKGDSVCYGEHEFRRRNWLESTIAGQAGTSVIADGVGRAKYKSCYMKKSFTEEESRLYYKLLSSDDAKGVLILCDSYGGAANNPDRVADTAIPQRSSCMKLQYMSYWNKPEDDEARLAGIRGVYEGVYSNSAVDAAHKGTPWHGEQYEGCYINYPDVDMLAYDYWPQLYFGNGDLYPFLQGVKRRYDPHNVFHHTMSVQA